MEFFSKAHDMKRQEHYHDMWLMGQYVAAALDATVCNAMPFIKRRQKGKYPEEPIRIMPLTEDEKKAAEERELRKFLGFADGFASEVNKKNGKGE